MAEHSVLPIFYMLAAAATSGSTALGLFRWLHGRPQLVHSINRGLCVGCDKCVQRCPTQVLVLDEENKARVVNARDCIECRQCEAVCKPQALIMHRRGQPPPEIERPDLDAAFQVRGRAGMYLIGHAAGVPMVKNAINLGRAAVEHLLRSEGFAPLRQKEAVPQPGVIADVDVAIVGSGPAGLSAAMSCAEKGLRFLIFERSSLTNSTVQCYPAGKDIHAVPPDVRCVGLLPMPADQVSKSQLTAAWQLRLEQSGVLEHLVKPAQVMAIEPAPAAEQSPAAEQAGAPRFLLRVENLDPALAGSRNQLYRAQRVILAIGESGPKRALDTPGEGLPLVRDSLGAASSYRKQRILIVGGGDTAVEAALQLSQPELENRVVLAVRKRPSELKASLRNQELLERRMRQRQLMVLYECTAVEIQARQVTLELRQEKRRRTLEVEVIFKLIGNEPATDWLKRQGVRFIWVRQDRVRSLSTDRLVEQLVGGPLPETHAPDFAAPESQQQQQQQPGSAEVSRNRLELPPPEQLLRPLLPVHDEELPAAARERKTLIMKRRARTQLP